ncbi:MAG: iron ABC transporter permease [Gammaproteobacteria bacterium]|nr:iron ABC transporter permease [Gammaproteobacteria bacterium]NNC97066.1 iron ABC transporter permease [Gammaproteobacteria bacterium]NNM14338.1 iron ABC transporter permease [Gammaproteobacteria bacterium]
MNREHIIALLYLLLLTFIVSVVGLSVGSVPIPFSEVLKTLFLDQDNSSFQQIIQQLRLPRVLAAFAVGGLLALAGVLMQVLLKNPLADPYIMGVSGGAAFGALIGLYFNAGYSLGYVFAAAGALLSIFLVFVIARGEGRWSSNRLLLTGIVLAAGWGALITLVLAVSPAKPLKSMLFWLMGDLSFARHAGLALLLLFLASGFGFLLARPMNILAQGDDQAELLGLNVTTTRRIIFILAAILTASAVIIGGTIGFIGLIIPHLMRLWKTGDHRWLVPASVLAGGSLLVLADTAARTLLAPQQLPVGALTAIIGVPLFLYLIRQQSR